MNRSDWLVPSEIPRVTTQLFCIGHAGAGASVFHSWREPLSAVGAQVVAVRLPGRETRLLEAPIRDYSSMISELADAVESHVGDAVTFFGHCVGALLAFGVVRSLESRGRTVSRLIVSGQAAPATLDPDEPPMSASSRSDFRAFLGTLGGMDPELLANDEFFAMVEPAIRADFALGESYPTEEVSPIATPITAFGTDDDPLAPVASVEAWRQSTTGSCDVTIRRGGHFLADDDWAELARLVAQTIGR